MLQPTLDLLSQLGVSFDDARDFIYDNVDQPEYIYQIAGKFGITFDMIADLYGNDVTGADVKGFFKLNGMSVENDTPEYTPDVFSELPEPDAEDESEEDESTQDSDVSGGGFDLSDLGLDDNWLETLQNQLDGLNLDDLFSSFDGLFSGLDGDPATDLITDFNQDDFDLSGFFGDFDFTAWIDSITSALSSIDFGALTEFYENFDFDALGLTEFDSGFEDDGFEFDDFDFNNVTSLLDGIDFDQILEDILGDYGSLFEDGLSGLIGIPEIDPDMFVV